jgi:hypothetical protein
MVRLARNQLGYKLLTPVMVPPPNHNQWPGLRLKAVLAHSDHGAGHWIAYVSVGGVWWRADSAQGAPLQEDPFAVQADPGQGRVGFTLDVFIFTR